MEYILSTDGTSLAYQRSGTGPPLVLIPGTPWDHRFWQPLFPAFSDSFTLYALDLRGRGGSSTANNNYTTEQVFQDIAVLIDIIGEPVYLLAHSSGARYALHAALCTSSIRRMVLYEPPPFRPQPPTIIQQFQELLKANDRDEVITIFVRDFVGTPPEKIASLRRTSFWQMMIENAHSLPQEFHANGSYRFDPPQFKKFRTPTLFLLGSESPPWAKAETETLSAVLHGSRVVILDGQGHGAMYTAPDLFVREVMDFFMMDT